MSKLIPVHGNVVLRPIEEEEQMAGNIVIPDMGQERPDMGEVIEISQIYNFHSDKHVPNEIKKGMKVLIPKMGAQNITIDGEDYWVTGIHSIIAILKD